MSLACCLLISSTRSLDFGRFKNINSLSFKNNVLTDAVVESILSQYVGQATAVNFCFASTNIYEKIETLDFINQIIHKLNSSIIVRLEEYTNIHVTRARRFNNVLFADNYESFLKIYGILKPNKFEYQGKYLVVITENYRLQLAGIKSILVDLWNIFIVNVNIIIKSLDGQSAQIYTFFPFTETYCGKVRPVLWNQFENGTFLNKTELFPEKTANLYQCPLKVVTFDIPPMMMIELRNDGNHIYRGVDGRLLKSLSEDMNFKINLTYMAIDSLRWGGLFPNGTSLGAMKKVQFLNLCIISKNTDLFLGN